MARRSDRRARRDEERAYAKAKAAQEWYMENGHSGAGMTLIAKLELRLVQELAKYKKLKADPNSEDTKISQQRGIVRGVAIGVATIRSPYEITKGIKNAELEAQEKLRG